MTLRNRWYVLAASLALIGIAMVTIALAADWLGISRYAGFGKGQKLLIVAGFLVLFVAVDFCTNRFLVRALTVYARWVRSGPPVVQRIHVGGWVLLWIVGFLIAVGFIGQWFGGFGFEVRPPHPYFMNGNGFYGNVHAIMRRGLESPEAFGYRKVGGGVLL